MPTRNRSLFVLLCAVLLSGCFHDWSKAERSDARSDSGTGGDAVAIIEQRGDGAMSPSDQGGGDAVVLLEVFPEVLADVPPDVSHDVLPDVSPDVLPDVSPRDLVDLADLASDPIAMPKDMGPDHPDTVQDAPAPPIETGIEVGRDVASPPPDVVAVLPEVGRDTALASLGTPCTAGGECASAVCADGVCCDRTCGSCSACKKALTGNTDGVCASVLSGQDPHNACADETLSQPCGKDGFCNGAGGCRNVAASAVCRSGDCAGSTLTDPSLCDGAGTCVAGAIKACPNATACSIDRVTCGNKLLPGATCTDGTQCNSGNCVDTPSGDSRICCANACSTCRGCDATGMACVFKTQGAPDATCGSSPGLCQANVCDAAGTCQPAVDGTTCGTNLYCKANVCSQPLLYDNLAAPLPWSEKSIKEWPGYTPMTISVENGRMVVKDPSAWSSSFVQWNSIFDFRNTTLQADMTATTTKRSLSYVMWGDEHTSIMAGLQRDEGSAYLFVNIADVQVVRLSAAAPTPIDQSQRVLLEIRATGQMRVLVDGVLVIDTTLPAASFSSLPATMSPCLGANSYPSQTFTFDNLWVWRL